MEKTSKKWLSKIVVLGLMVAAVLAYFFVRVEMSEDKIIITCAHPPATYRCHRLRFAQRSDRCRAQNTPHESNEMIK